MTALTFNEEIHEYRLDDRPVPSVTQIIHESIPTFKAHQWYLNRGRVVHKCAELIANGIQFKHDPAVDGQVKAIKKVFSDLQPKVISTETLVCSRTYQFAGTLDLLAVVNGHRMIIDWKGTVVAELIGLQCAGYSLTDLLTHPPVNYALGVQLNDNGTYKITEPIKLKSYRRDFLALRTVYGIKQRMNLIGKEPQ